MRWEWEKGLRTFAVLQVHHAGMKNIDKHIALRNILNYNTGKKLFSWNSPRSSSMKLARFKNMFRALLYRSQSETDHPSRMFWKTLSLTFFASEWLSNSSAYSGWRHTNNMFCKYSEELTGVHYWSYRVLSLSCSRWAQEKGDVVNLSITIRQSSWSYRFKSVYWQKVQLV